MTTWRARSDFRLAVRAQDGGDFRRARQMYTRVLEDAPDHVSARHNLAVVALRERYYQRALILIDSVLDDYRQEFADNGRLARSELHCSLRYNKALALTLSAQHEGRINRAIAQAALECARELVTDVLERLDDRDEFDLARLEAERTRGDKRVRQVLGQLIARDWLFKRRRGTVPANDDELLMLKKIELSTIMLLADIVLQHANKLEVWEASARKTLKAEQAAAEQAARKPPVQPTGGRNTSSNQAQKTRKCDILRERRTKRKQILDYPDKPDAAPGWVYRAELYVRSHEQTGARAYYNLACYRGRILQALNIHSQDKDLREQLYQSVLGDLSNALMDESLIAWADDDPALADVRQHDGWRESLMRQQDARLGARPTSRETP